MKSHVLRTAVVAFSLLVAGAALADDLKPGTAAPEFTLTDQTGKTHTLSDYHGKTVVLEWTNQTCPFVQRHYKADTMIKLAAANQDVVWLAIDSSNFTTAASCAKWAKSQEIPYPILVDASGDVGRLYHAKTTPHMFVIDTEGKIAYNGAIDDDPRGDKDGTTNFVAAALHDLKAGHAVENASTKPYGCSVKYADKAKAKDKAASASR